MTGKRGKGTEDVCPLYKNTDRGWAWIIALSGFFLHIIVGGQRRSMGLFFLEIVEYYDTTKSEASIVASVFYVTSLCIAPVAALLVKRLSVRSVIASGGIAIGIAFVIAAFVKNLEVTILTVGGLSGIGSGLLHAPMLILVGQYFEKWRTFAIGLCLAGGAVGAFVFPPIVSLSMELYGYPGMMLIVAGMCLHAVVFAMLLRPPEKYDRCRTSSLSRLVAEDDIENECLTKSKENGSEAVEFGLILIDEKKFPKESGSKFDYIDSVDDMTRLTASEDKDHVELELNIKEAKDDQDEYLDEKTLSKDNIALNPITDNNEDLGPCARFHNYVNTHDILKKPTFYLYALCGALGTEMLPIALFLIPPISNDAGIGLETQSFILLLMGIPDLICRLGIGVIADKFSKWRADIFMFLLLVKAGLWLYVSLLPNFLSILIFALFTGFLGGGIFTLYLPILVDAVGLRNMNLIFSVSLVMEGIFCLIFPPLLAYVRDASGSWLGSCRMMMGVSIFAVLLIIYDSRFLQWMRKSISNRNRDDIET